MFNYITFGSSWGGQLPDLFHFLSCHYAVFYYEILLLLQEQYEKEQQAIQRQIEKSRQEAEESERNRKNLV